MAQFYFYKTTDISEINWQRPDNDWQRLEISEIDKIYEANKEVCVNILIIYI